jgi:signal peptidase II
VVLVALSLGVVLADQATKYLVLNELTQALDTQPTTGARLGKFFHDSPEAGFDGFHYRSKRAITVSESFLRLRYAENPGAAFGLFRQLPEAARGPLFHLVSLGAVVLIIYYFRKLQGTKAERWAYFGLPLVLGGAVGNYVDRLSRGFVIDYLEAHWFDKPGWTWPSFNVADTAICIGVGMLVIDSLVRREKKERAAVAG